MVPHDAPEALRLLVVEDNDGDRDLLVEYLDLAGLRFELQAASTMQEALALLSDGPHPDVMLLDLGLPDSDGIATVETVLGVVPGVPVVVLTGMRDEEMGRGAIRAGAQDYLVKGTYAPETLARAIRYSRERHAQTERIEHLNRVVSAIRRINALMVRERDPRSLLRQACEILVGSGGYRAVWVALLDEDGHASVRHQALPGQSATTEEDLQHTPLCLMQLAGASGTRVGTEVCHQCDDCWVPGASAQRCSAVIELPHAVGGRTALGIVMDGETALVDEEVALLQEVAEDVSFALSNIEAEAKLEESEAFLQAALDQSQAGIILVDAPEGHVRFANRAALEVLGVPEDHLEGRPPVAEIADTGRIFRPDGTPCDPEALVLARAARTGQSGSEELIIETGSKAVRHVLANAAPVKDDAGEVFAAVGVFNDITAQKNAEETLRDSEANLKMAQRVANLGSWVWDVRSDELRWSDQMFEIFGIDPGAFTGRLQDVLAAAIHPEDLPTVAASNRSVMERAEPIPVEYRVLRPDGTVRHVYAEAGELVTDDDGDVVQLSGIVMDITERKEAEHEQTRLQTQLTQAQKMESVGRLAGGIAHDFNNMLQTIIGNAELARFESDDPEELEQLLAEIQEAAERSARLTRQLLGFARQQAVEPVVLDLNETINAMLKILQRLIGDDIRLSWQPAPTLWPVKIDPGQVDQILANLAVNAKDAIGDLGNVTVQTEDAELNAEAAEGRSGIDPGDYVVISVTDDGQGMDPEQLDNIFEPFFTTKKQGEGTGLGLSTVYGIARQNGGWVEVESQVGQGSTFRVYLPRHPGELPADEEPALIGEQPSGEETILLVEDEPSVLRLGELVLGRQGYTVLVANNPLDGLKAAEEHAGTIDLLISDVVMPEMNGQQLANRVLAMRPGIKVLFMSGHSKEVITHHGLLPKGINLLQKPFGVSDLLRRTREVLESDGA